MPIMLIAHTAKIPDDRTPSFRDIRDSSFISQEADTVFMLWRLKSKNSARNITEETTEDIYTNKAILSIELDRVSGNSGKIKLLHNGVKFIENPETIKIKDTYLPY